jgi:hypothetical protein
MEQGIAEERACEEQAVDLGLCLMCFLLMYFFKAWFGHRP